MAIGFHSYKLIHTFSQPERDAFSKQLDVSESNSDNLIIDLYHSYEEHLTLKKATNAFGQKRKGYLEKGSKFRVLNTRLFKKLKEFIVQRSFHKDWKKEIRLLEELHNRGLHKAFMLNYHQIKKEMGERCRKKL